MFSALKQAPYLRSKTGDSTLNYLMMLHVHKDRTDALSLVDVAYNFKGSNNTKSNFFGKFQQYDIPDKVTLFSKSTQTEGYRKE